jgi:hypothetical protein
MESVGTETGGVESGVQTRPVFLLICHPITDSISLAVHTYGFLPFRQV